MRRVKNYNIERDRGASRDPVSFGLVMKYRDRFGNHLVPIQAGKSDDIYVFRDGDYTLLLSMNQKFGYVGLDVYQGDEKINDIFLQNDSDITSTLGEKGFERSPRDITKRLWEILAKPKR